MRIAVVGCGRIGHVTGACFAQLGHQLLCVDKDQEKIDEFNKGNLLIYEPFLEEMVLRNRKEGRLEFTTDAAAAVNWASAIFICVGVPRLESGETDLSAIDSVARVIATQAVSEKLVVIRSTVPVQTGRQLQNMLMAYARRPGAQFLVAANPQFLREGTAVADFFHPSKILFGIENSCAEKHLREIYKPLLEGSFRCPVHASCPHGDQPEVLVTSGASAELIKHASNSFLAVKISYANMVSNLCEKLGADIEQVIEGVGLDKRIGNVFLQAGLGFGGFRLPQDIRKMISLTNGVGVDSGMLREAERINKQRIDQFLEKICSALWVVQNKSIGLLGLAYKPDTDDIRCSPALDLIRRLLKMGADVRAFDPKAMDNAKRSIPDIVYGNDAYAVAEGVDALIIATEWAEFRCLDWKRINRLMARPLLLDGRNLLNPTEMKALGFEYYSIGRPS